MQNNKRKLKVIFFSYLISVVVLIIASIVIMMSPIESNIKWSIVLIIVVVLLVVSLFARPYIEFYTQRTRLDALNATANPPIACPIEVASEQWIARLQAMGFILNKEFKDYYLAHRVHEDPNNLVLKRGILEVIVFVRNHAISFTDERFNRTIHQIEDEYAKQKIKYHHYTIFVFKSGPEITNEIQTSVNEVYFNKSNHRFVNVIHAYYIQKTKQIYFLHSDTEMPNIFYQEAVDVLKETVGIR